MKKVLSILKWTLGILALLVLALFIYVQLAWSKKYEAPLPDIKASADSAVIARGKYLAFGPSHCATCHVPMDKSMEVENGLEIPLSGGWELEIPGFGKFRAPNITPDPETGIGKLSDGELARTLRHAVGSDGRLIAPFMPYQNMSDDDVQALISFMRSQPPVKNKIEKTEWSFVAKALMAFGVMKPESPKVAPPKSLPPDTTAAYGEYLAVNVANCKGCHTRMDPNSGALVGQPFAGGNVFSDAFTKGHSMVSPNITPHPGTGVISSWDFQRFKTRMQGGRVLDYTPMPWGALSRLTDNDVKAIYAYLKSLPAVDHKIVKTDYAPGEKPPVYTNNAAGN
jgi:mono/diheme cytochrome c family protein